MRTASVIKKLNYKAYNRYNEGNEANRTIPCEVLQLTIGRFKAPIEIESGVNYVKACGSIVLNVKYLHSPNKRYAMKIWRSLHRARISCATH
jgi:hypothetical protein